MPSEKRERQRAGRQARREAARAAQRRAQRRRQVIAIVALVAVVFGIAFVVSQRGDDDATNVATDDTTQNGDDADGNDGPPEYGPTPCPPATGAEARQASFPEPPAKCLEDGVDYKATVETDVGTFTLDLYEDRAPLTVNNFVFLALNKAYEGVAFHRVIPGFVVQGGDVEKGDGTGGPGYQFPDELPKQGEYKLGSLAMANSGPNTNGSQFFVITGDQGVSLPPSYALFGEVTEGFEEVVKKIEADGSAGGTPTVTHKIVKVTITTG